MQAAAAHGWRTGEYSFASASIITNRGRECWCILFVGKDMIVGNDYMTYVDVQTGESEIVPGM